jgi:subtilisin-like proprotein convertase family protein
VSGAPGSVLGTDVYLDKVDLIAQHVRDMDLDIFLQSPNGTEIDLTSDNGGTGDHYGNPAACPGQVTTFAPWAGGGITSGTAPFIGTYTPEGAFSTFNGSNVNGNWALRVCDDATTNAGSFMYTKLHFITCPRPSALSAASATTNGATVTWTESGTATTWDLEFQPAGTAATGTPTVSGVASKPYVWTGGQQATNYQAWVRSNCGGGVSEWIGPVTFLTHLDNAAPVCVAFNIPDGGCFGSGTNSFQMPVSVSGAPGTTLGSDVFLNRVDLIVQHVFNSNVSIGLVSPSGIEINLCDGNGGSGDNFGNPAACPAQVTSFDTWAAGSITAGSAPFIGSYRPETPFSTFDGANPNGTWMLKVCDVLNGSAGSLRYVKLSFSTSLPVALTTFTATPVEEKSVRLLWTTATEHNSARFDIERSADGQHYYTIASIAAAGNSSDEHKYEWIDRKPLPAENYYRLRQIDTDGKFAYSPVRVAVIQDDNLNWLVYPNPAQASFFVENREEEGWLSLFDVAGNLVLEQPLSAGNRNTEIKTEGLPSGFYGIKIQTGNAVFSSRVVIERE